MIEYLLIVLGVFVFGLQHSGISSLRVKSWIIDRWQKSGYARIFNTTSVLALLLAFLSMGYWDWAYFLTSPQTINVLLFGLGLIAVFAGLMLASAASKVISVSTVADMRTDRKPQLVTDGIYSRVRHPLYLATIVLLIGLALLYPFPRVVVFAFSLSCYVLVGAYLEERKLIHHYGQEYLDYRKKVGFMLPRLRKK